VPLNCLFKIDDFEQGWLFKTKFEYIHGRELKVPSVTRPLNTWSLVATLNSTLATVTSNPDGSHEKAESANLCGEIGREAAEKFGKSFENVPTWKEMMDKAGVVDVKEKISKLPTTSKNPCLNTEFP
jgi:hypothetical protein